MSSDNLVKRVILKCRNFIEEWEETKTRVINESNDFEQGIAHLVSRRKERCSLLDEEWRRVLVDDWLVQKARAVYCSSWMSYCVHEQLYARAYIRFGASYKFIQKNVATLLTIRQYKHCFMLVLNRWLNAKNAYLNSKFEKYSFMFYFL